MEGRGPGADGWTLPGKPPAGQAPMVVSSQFPASKSERKPPVPSLLQGQEQRTSVWGCRGKETRQGAPGSLEATSWDKPPLTFVPRQCKPGREPPAARRPGRFTGSQQSLAPVAPRKPETSRQRSTGPLARRQGPAFPTRIGERRKSSHTPRGHRLPLGRLSSSAVSSPPPRKVLRAGRETRASPGRGARPPLGTLYFAFCCRPARSLGSLFQPKSTSVSTLTSWSLADPSVTRLKSLDAGRGSPSKFGGDYRETYKIQILRNSKRVLTIQLKAVSSCASVVSLGPL